MLLQFVSLTTFYYLTYNHYFSLILFTYDNMMLSYNTICDIYHLPYKSMFYTGSYIDRYIYYMLLITIKPFLQLMFYNYNSYLLNYILCITILPIFFTQLLIYIDPIFFLIKRQYAKCIKLITYEVVNYIITLVCLNTLNYNPCLNRKEIAVLLKKNHKDNILQFIKSFILLTIINTLSDGNTFTLNIVKKIYNKKAVYKYKDPFPTIKTDIDKIKTILVKRQWQQFFNPYIIHLMTNLYTNNDKVVHKLSKSLRDYELAFAKMFTILTFCKFMLLYDVEPYVIFVSMGIVSLLLAFGDKNRHQFTITVGGLLIGYYMDNYTLGAFLCEYTHLCFLRLIIWGYKSVEKWAIYNQHVLTHYNLLNYYLLTHLLLSFIDPTMIYVVFLICNAKYPLLTGYVLFFGYFSNYNILHLCYLSLVCYVVLNLVHYKSAPKPKIPMLYITNYTPPLLPAPKKEEEKEEVKNNLTTKYKPIVVSKNIKPIKAPKILTYYPILSNMHNPKYIIVPT
jgi:hypothetical protein